MKRAVAVTLALLLLAWSAFADDMAEAARRERERRKKAQEAGQAATVVTGDDLRNGKGQLANDPSAAPAASPAPSPRPASTAAEPTGDSDAARRASEAQWRSRAALARQRVADWQERYDYWSKQYLAPGEYFVDEDGQKLVGSAENLQKLIARAKARLDEAKKALEDLEAQARRENVPPGWLR